MTDAIRHLSTLPELRDPVLIVALTVRRRGGRAAGNALGYVIEQWNAKQVAAVDSQAYYDFTVRRPEGRRTDTTHEIEWPEPQIFLASPEGANRDFLLFLGFEPNFAWPTFIDTVTDYATAAGVKTMMVVRSFPANIPHTRPASVSMSSTDGALEALFGITEPAARYEGEADIGSVLSAKAQALGLGVLDVSLLQPFYYPRMPNAFLTLSLVGILDKAFGTHTPDASLREASESQRAAIDEIVAADDSMRTLVSELEKAHDAGVETSRYEEPDPDADPNPGSTALPSGEELIQDIERLLREQRNPGS